MFSCEYCEIFKETYFEEHLQTADSVDCEKITMNIALKKKVSISNYLNYLKKKNCF